MPPQAVASPDSDFLGDLVKMSPESCGLSSTDIYTITPPQISPLPPPSPTHQTSPSSLTSPRMIPAAQDDTCPTPDLPVRVEPAHENHATMGCDMREKRPSVLLRDYVTNTNLSRLDTSLLQSKYAGTSYPIANFMNCDSFSLPHRMFLANIIAGVEPRTFKDAMRDS